MPENDLQLLTDAARHAGEIAKQYFKADPEKWEKSDGQGPVTEADLAVDNYLRQTLIKERPDYGWLSEETEDSVDRLQKPYTFIVDPIDGTRAFIAGENNFAHSLAIAKDGEVIAAVVYLPVKDLMYSAIKGGGAFANKKKIFASKQAKMPEAKILTNRANMKPEMWSGQVPNFKLRFRPSLAYRICLAAEGRYDGMLTLRDTWEWDVAAGDLIAREAGVIVTTRKNTFPKYNNKTPKISGMVAANPPLHSQLMDCL